MDWFLLLIIGAVLVFLGCVVGSCHDDYLTYRIKLYQLETERLERLERARAEAFVKPELIDDEDFR